MLYTVLYTIQYTNTTQYNTLILYYDIYCTIYYSILYTIHYTILYTILCYILYNTNTTLLYNTIDKWRQLEEIRIRYSHRWTRLG